MRENVDPLRNGLASASIYQPPPHPLESGQMKVHTLFILRASLKFVRAVSSK